MIKCPTDEICIDPKETMGWSVYIIQCTNDSLYTGITNNIQRRFSQHLNRRGAKFFRGHRPKRVVYVENGHTRSSASRREAAIKKQPRIEKLHLILSSTNEIHDQKRVESL